jgi:hypothetical protein
MISSVSKFPRGESGSAKIGKIIAEISSRKSQQPPPKVVA